MGFFRDLFRRSPSHGHGGSGNTPSEGVPTEDTLDMASLDSVRRVLQSDLTLTEGRVETYMRLGQYAKAKHFRRRLEDIETRLMRIERQLADIEAATDEYRAYGDFR